jgi:hypothetical protein
MPSLVLCGSCGSKLKVPDQFAGRRAKCSKCGNVIEVKRATPPAPVSPRPKPKPPKRKEIEERPVVKCNRPEPADEPLDISADDIVEKAKPKKKKRRRKQPIKSQSSVWWWVGGLAVFFLLAFVTVVGGIRAGHGPALLMLGLMLGIMLPISLVILIVSMILSSMIAGGIDFGELHTAILKAISLLLAVNVVSLIPFFGIILAFPIWLLGLMYLFGLDFWEARFLIFINWFFNFLAKILLVGILLHLFMHGGFDRGGVEDVEPKAAVTQQDKDVMAISELGGQIAEDENDPEAAITRISLANRLVKDDDLVHLKSFTALQFLDLSGTRVTDAGLVHLKVLNRLRQLNLMGTATTDAGVEDLQQALPQTIIAR